MGRVKVKGGVRVRGGLRVRGDKKQDTGSGDGRIGEGGYTKELDKGNGLDKGIG